MINIFIYGLDPFILRQASKFMTSKLSLIYETKKDNINFYGCEGLVVHDGVEQNDWNIIVRVESPTNYKVFENQVVKVLKEYLKDLCVNMEITFTYFEMNSFYEFIREDHPRFIDESNSVYLDESYDEEEGCEDCGDDCECHHHHDDEGSEEEPYLGDIFKDFNK